MWMGTLSKLKTKLFWIKLYLNKEKKIKKIFLSQLSKGKKQMLQKPAVFMITIISVTQCLIFRQVLLHKFFVTQSKMRCPKDPGFKILRKHVTQVFMVSLRRIREGNGNPLQYSCLENPMDRGTWQAAVHGVAKSQTWLSDFNFTFHFHSLEKETATHSSVFAWRIPGIG